MEKESTGGARKSSVEFEFLEDWVRGKVQEYIQFLLEQEVEELLGRQKWERKAAVDPEKGYRNGYGKRRHLTLSCGTVELKRPRVRGLEQRFVSTDLV